MPPLQQRRAFDVLLVAAVRGAWAEVEGRLWAGMQLDW